MVLHLSFLSVVLLGIFLKAFLIFFNKTFLLLGVKFRKRVVASTGSVHIADATGGKVTSACSDSGLV